MKWQNQIEEYLIIGIGNSGRRDDGLGWAFLEALEDFGLDPNQMHYRYQLQVEDAAMISSYPKVLFVDATERRLENGYQIEAVLPTDAFAFTSHVLPPEAIVYLAKELYQANPQAFTLAIEGKEWGLQQGLSATAKSNLAQALTFFQNNIHIKNEPHGSVR